METQEKDLASRQNVIKRNGKEVNFDISKIANAIRKANKEVEPIYQMNEYQIDGIAENVAGQCAKLDRAVSVEEIQDMVETGIMEMRGYEVAQKYVRYRYTRELARKANTTDEEILSLLDQSNEEAKQENSNKNPVINSTQRDYMAGLYRETSPAECFSRRRSRRRIARVSSTSMIPITSHSGSTTVIS